MAAGRSNQMNIDKVLKCQVLAKQFLSRASDVRNRYRSDQETEANFFGTKETAALRRASMDLTRALAELRRS